MGVGQQEGSREAYVEKILAMVEQHEFKAELLSEVLHYDDDEPELLKAVWDVGGGIKAVKSQAKVPMPTNSEELRARLGVLGTAWMFAAFQQTNCNYLVNLTPQLWQEYLDYLLGDHVALLCSRD